MNGISVLLMVVVILLLLVISFALYLMMSRQEKLEHRMMAQNERSKTNLALMQDLERKVDTVSERTGISLAASKDLSSQMHSITQVMANAKARGTWGEYQLESLVRTYLGGSPYIFSTQYHLKNGRISDGAFHLPGSDKVLCIDAKFPMENFIKMSEEPQNADYYEKELRRNVKKHISDIAAKYINEETMDEAVLFLPSEGIFAWICAEGSDLMDYALKEHVMLVSPTTLAGVVFTLLAVTRNFYRSQNLSHIEEKIERLENRAELLAAQSEKVRKSERLLEKQIAELSRSCSRLFAEIDELAHPEDDFYSE